MRAEAQPLPLPLPLRAWQPLAAHAPVGVRMEVTARLARRLLQSDHAYVGARGFVMRIDPADRFQAAMLAGAYDPIVEKLVEHHAAPGSAAVDAGAHLGYFTLRLARAVGPQGSVHALECDPRLLPRLREHVDANGLHWVQISELAAADRSGDELTLHLPAQLGWASIREGIWPDEQTVTVRTATIDDVLDDAGVAPTAVSFVKLDVEGAEIEALRGLRRTLGGGRAAVLVEFIPWRMRALGQDPDDLLAALAEHGYAPWSAQRRGSRVQLVPGVAPSAGEDVLFLKR